MTLLRTDCNLSCIDGKEFTDKEKRRMGTDECPKYSLGFLSDTLCFLFVLSNGHLFKAFFNYFIF